MVLAPRERPKISLMLPRLFVRKTKNSHKQPWGSPKASHVKESQPHFLHFPAWKLLRPLFFCGERDLPHFLTLPARQKKYCEYFFSCLPGNFALKNGGESRAPGIFGEFFLVSVSHKTKHEKSSRNSGRIRSKIRGKIRDKISKKFGELSSLQLF